MSNEEIIQQLRLGPKLGLSHFVKSLYDDFKEAAVKAAKVDSGSFVEFHSDTRLCCKRLVFFLEKYSEETRKELQRVFAGFQLGLRDGGKYWRLCWNPTVPSAGETILVEADTTTDRTSFHNSNLIRKLQQGPRFYLPIYATALHKTLMTAIQDEMKMSTCSFSCYEDPIRILWDESRALVRVFHSFPEETREELRRLFHGFQLLLRQTQQGKMSWILRWDPPKVPDDPTEVTLLVDFPTNSTAKIVSSL